MLVIGVAFGLLVIAPMRDLLRQAFSLQRSARTTQQLGRRLFRLLS
jgi:hypothetical protein